MCLLHHIPDFIAADRSSRLHVVAASRSYPHSAADTRKLRQYLNCRRHTARSSDNKTNENLNHRNVESKPGMRNDRAHDQATAFTLPRERLFRYHAITRRFRVFFQDDTRSGGFGNGNEIHSNLAAVSVLVLPEK